MKKITAILLAVLMILAVVPLAAVAEPIEAAAVHAKMWRDTDAVWAAIDARIAELDAIGASEDDIVNAVYDIASAGKGVVEVAREDGKVYFRHESGMENIYDYRVNHADTLMPGTEDYGKVETTLRSLESATDLDVLLLGPYYGQDSSFTNQYRNEAQSIANYTQGNYTIYQGTGVDANACRAAEDYGVIIFDSHGVCMNGKSYLCLTTQNGFTNDDFTSGRAARSGGDALVTGAFWEYYCPDMKASCVWMAICEGMMTNTLGQPLLNAGCAVVYGYSQSVTFSGDYLYEATFWNHMKQGETFADSYDAMIAAHGIYDPYGDAYPVVMSEDDDYPANPDSHQTVYCQWHLPTPSDLVVTDVASVSIPQSNYGVAPTFTAQIVPAINPEGANNYTSTWTSSNESVATVNKKGVVTGVAPGTATITLTVASKPTSNSTYTYTASTTVTVDNSYLPEEVMYVPVNEVVPGETYVIGFTRGTKTIIMGSEFQNTSNGRNLLAVNATLGEVAGKTCIVSEVTPGQEWVWNSDGSVKNVQKGQYLNLSGNYLSMGASPVQWAYAANEDGQTGTVTNNANNIFKYLGVSNNDVYFGVFMSAYQIRLYRKLVRGSVGVMGDADGNGVANSADALMIMRYAMGDHSVIPADRLAYCDLDGNGVVNSADALKLMRMSMGL